MHLPAIGKVNRRLLIEDLHIETIQNDGTSASYIEVLQPIDGWDIFEIIENSYWRKRYKKETTGIILHSTLYMPVIYVPDIVEKGTTILFYLYAYQITNIDGRLKFKFLNRTVMM